MKKITFLTLAILLSFSIKSFSQNCAFFLPMKTAAGVEMSSYNAKDKFTGSTVSKVTSVSSQSTVTIAKIHAESFDENKKSTGVNDYEVKCSGNSVSIDARSLISQEMLKSYKDMDVKIEATDIEIPANLAVGATLNDGSLTMNVSMNGMAMSNMTFTYKNRKVAAIQNITTTAGTFECYKITCDVVMESSTMGFSMKVNSNFIDYVSKNVGSVKSEVIDEKGKLLSYSLLTKIL